MNEQDANAVAVRQEVKPISVQEMRGQINQIQMLMKDCMTDKEHYGTIPGCGDKPTLLKPGAEKLSMMFRLAPSYEVIERDLSEGHREYRVTCTLTHSQSGNMIGQGVGLCSTMGAKYRYRMTSSYEIVGGADAIPADYKQKKAEYRKKGYGCKKDDTGQWQWVKSEEGGREENPDIADAYNTVLKIPGYLVSRTGERDVLLASIPIHNRVLQFLNQRDVKVILTGLMQDI